MKIRLKTKKITSLFLVFLMLVSSAYISVASEETYYSSTNGGTTIQLPFGFVQWHKGQLQFHHSFYKLCDMLD